MKDFKLLAAHDYVDDIKKIYDGVSPEYFKTICEKHGETECHFDKRCRLCVKEEHEQALNAEIKAHVTKLIADLCIPKRYVDSELSNYKITDDDQQKCINKLNLYNFSQNLLFLGKTGTGKTHFAFWLLKRYISEKYNFLEAKSNVFYTKYYNLTQSKIDDKQHFKTLLNSDFLIIDEIATANSDFKINLLFEVIDQRYDNMLPTMLISNLGPEKFKTLISDALYSRLKESSVILYATWEDYRLNAK